MNTTQDAVRTESDRDRPSKLQSRIGLGLTVLLTLFFLFDAVPKLLSMSWVVEPSVKLGFTAGFVPVIGALLAIGLVLYLIPRTSVFGAVFITAYLGGAVCTNVLAKLPLFGFVLAPVYTAILLWLALYLRSTALRRLVRTGF
ncbi:MAG TPA: DoxX family protein [Pseudonocardia sp.]|jgi:hypothetical protein